MKMIFDRNGEGRQELVVALGMISDSLDYSKWKWACRSRRRTRRSWRSRIRRPASPGRPDARRPALSLSAQLS